MAQFKIKYARDTLLSLRFWWKNPSTNVGRATTLCYQSVGYCHEASKILPLTESTWNALKENGLLKRTRGTRGGVKKENWGSRERFPITTTTFSTSRSFKSSRSKFAYHGSQSTANLNNLIQITSPMTTNEAEHNKQNERTSSLTSHKTGLLFACFNARSLRNKVEAVTDHIVNENIDICVFTETWLKDCDNVTIAGMSPTGYEFKNFPRLSERRGGGTGIMFKNSLNVNMSDGNEKQSFEFSEWSVRVHQQVINIVSVYRPPYSTEHPISSRVFFNEFSAYLEDIVMAPGILLITGDFNFHVDCRSDNDAKNFADILQTFGLQQHVQVPTHLTGHTLDLIITRSNNDITVSSPKSSVALSDHFFIECNLNIPRPSSNVKETLYRKLKTLDLHAFKTDITESMLCTATWNNVSELASCYENTLTLCSRNTLLCKGKP